MEQQTQVVIVPRDCRKKIDHAVKQHQTLHRANYFFAHDFVFFADQQHAARAGQLRDKIRNSLWFYDIFSQEVRVNIGMTHTESVASRNVAQTAAYMFASVAKGTAYLVLGKDEDVIRPLGLARWTHDVWHYFQAGVLTAPGSKVTRIIRVNAEDFALRGTVWETGQKQLVSSMAHFKSKLSPQLGLYDGYIGEVEWPICSMHHCLQCQDALK